MKRTIITIPDEMKIWLDTYSKKLNRPTAETIREAIAEYKERVEKERKNILSDTAGLWKNKRIDGIDYVERLRDEWERK